MAMPHFEDCSWSMRVAIVLRQVSALLRVAPKGPAAISDAAIEALADGFEHAARAFRLEHQARQAEWLSRQPKKE
jgi:hypothetical protein